MGVAKLWETPAGKIAGGCVVAVAVVWLGMRFFHSDDINDLSRKRPFVCATTGKGFYLEVEVGMQVPVMSPFTHEKTGYPAELCYWNADGTIRKVPTLVLVNGPVPNDGPVFCPDCGRLVIGRNPAPTPGSHPPPTREEYAARGH